MNPNRFAALFPVAIAFAIGGAAARVWLAGAPHRIAIDLAQPLVVVTAWGNYGTVAFAILAATVALASAWLIVASRRLVRSAGQGDTLTVTLVAALSVAAAFAWPFVFSSDTYAYAAYGKMVNDGLDPYTPLPAAVHGALYDATRWQWSGAYPVCVYGPAFVAVAAALVRATSGFGVPGLLWAMRLLAAVAFVASIPLLGAALAAWPARRRFLALCAYGLNPAILWTVAEGHNDALLLLLVMGAGAIAVRWPALGAMLLGLGPLVKAPGAALAIGAALEATIRGGRGRRAVLLSLLAALAIAALIAILPLLPALAATREHGRYAPAVSAQGLVGPAAAILLAAFAAGFGVRRLARRDRGGFAWLGIALLVALPNGYPWYALWLVPWCLAAGDTWASRGLWAATILAVARYLPDAAGTLGPEAARLASALAVAPLLLAGADIRRPAPARKKAQIIP